MSAPDTNEPQAHKPQAHDAGPSSGKPSPAPTGSPQQGPPRSSARRLLQRVLYAVLLAAAVFAAWQGHQMWRQMQDLQGPPPSPARPVRPSLGTGAVRVLTRPAPRAASSPAATAPTQPASGLAGLPGELAVESSEEDPVGFAPPSDANGRRAYVMPDSSVVALYEWAGTVEAAAHHYRQTLQGAGYELLDASADESSWTYLKFGGPRRVIVALRKDPRDARMVEIQVTVIRPAR